MSKRNEVDAPAIRYDPSGRTVELLRIAKPSGRSGVAAAVGAHVCGVVVPGASHWLTACLGVLFGLTLSALGIHRFITIVGPLVVPLAVTSTATGAEAIARVDTMYLPTAVVIATLTVGQEIAHRAYERSPVNLLVPVPWVLRTSNAEG